MTGCCSSPDTVTGDWRTWPDNCVSIRSEDDILLSERSKYEIVSPIVPKKNKLCRRLLLRYRMLSDVSSSNAVESIDAITLLDKSSASRKVSPAKPCMTITKTCRLYLYTQHKISPAMPSSPLSSPSLTLTCLPCSARNPPLMLMLNSIAISILIALRLYTQLGHDCQYKATPNHSNDRNFSC